MINTETGEMEFDNVHINKNMKINDFKKYAEKGLVNISSDYENGQGIVRLTNKVKSNDILAKIKIEIHGFGVIVYIFPSTCVGENKIIAGKKWLAGMIEDRRITQYENQISLQYDWGYIVAQYMPDRDYGTVGGEIHIAYKDEERDDI